LNDLEVSYQPAKACTLLAFPGESSRRAAVPIGLPKTGDYPKAAPRVGDHCRLSLSKALSGPVKKSPTRATGRQGERIAVVPLDVDRNSVAPASKLLTV